MNFLSVNFVATVAKRLVLHPHNQPLYTLHTFRCSVFHLFGVIILRFMVAGTARQFAVVCCMFFLYQVTENAERTFLDVRVYTAISGRCLFSYRELPLDVDMWSNTHYL